MLVELTLKIFLYHFEIQSQKDFYHRRVMSRQKWENVENRKYSTCPGNEVLTKTSLHRSTNPFVASLYLGQEYKSGNWDIKHRIIWAEVLPFFIFMKKIFDEAPCYVCKSSKPVETTNEKNQNLFYSAFSHSVCVFFFICLQGVFTPLVSFRGTVIFIRFCCIQTLF